MTDPLPKERLGDRLHQLAQAGMSAVPVVGGPAAVLFNMVVKMPIQRRWRIFFEDIAERLARLEEEGRIKIKDLENNEEFISTLMQASAVAVRNHQQEKHDALRNAVVNTALGQSADDAKREMFLGFVETLTVWHLGVFAFLADPTAGVDAKQLHQELLTGAYTSVIEVLQGAFPGLTDQREFVLKILDDLTGNGLILGGATMSAFLEFRGIQNLTQLGTDFLGFVTEPKDN